MAKRKRKKRVTGVSKDSMEGAAKNGASVPATKPEMPYQDPIDRDAYRRRTDPVYRFVGSL